MALRMIGVVALLSLSIMSSIQGSEGQCIRPISNVQGCRSALSEAIFYNDTTNLTPDCCNAVNRISNLCFILLFPTRPASIRYLKTICASITAPPIPEAPPPPTPTTPPPSTAVPATPPPSTPPPSTSPPSTATPPPSTPPPSTSPPSTATPPPSTPPPSPPPSTVAPPPSTPPPSTSPPSTASTPPSTPPPSNN